MFEKIKELETECSQTKQFGANLDFEILRLEDNGRGYNASGKSIILSSIR
jgi:hypothetical protein